MKSLKPITKAVSISILVILGITLTVGTSAYAHERRGVGKYQLVVGFIVEPPIEGQKNGIDFRVTDNTTGKPVLGLEKTIQVEITHVTSATTKVFPIRTIFGDPGHYTNDLIMTAPGQYRFRFFGNIESTPMNETFTSGPGTFGDVEPSTDLQFPLQLPQTREIVAATKGAQNSATQAEDAASSARTLGLAGVILGAIGVVLGAGSFMVAIRKR